MPTVSNEFLHNVVSFIAGAGDLLEKSGTAKAETRRKAPEVVDVLIEKGLLEPMRKDAAIKTLSENPAAALESLRRTALRVSDEPPRMGSPESKTAGATEAGREPVRESDRAFLSRLGF